jgi:hypothetical protein
MTNVEKFLMKWEAKIIPQILAILTGNRRNASKRLYNSIKDKGFLYKTTRTGLEIVLQYAKHGKYVLDNRRNGKKMGPSIKGGYSAINSIKRWILQKGISIGGGKIRTPLKKKGTTSYNAHVQAKN